MVYNQLISHYCTGLNLNQTQTGMGLRLGGLGGQPTSMGIGLTPATSRPTALGIY